jgi:hypothetical protein
MPEDTNSEKEIKHDAGIFLSRIGEVERIIEGLTPASMQDGPTANAVMERLDDLDCLRFTAWCVGHDAEWLSSFLTKLAIQPDGVELITAFASKYSSHDLFLTRLNRANQGYENELTRLSSRPSIQTFGNNAMVTLRLYSHDRLLATSSNGLDGLIELINMLIETANDTAESFEAFAPELLQKALDPDELLQILKGAEALRQRLDRLRATTK